VRRTAAVVLAAVLPAPALAHGFVPGGDPWSQILGGALIPWSDPALLLALLPLGLTLGLWRRDAVARLWPAFAAGIGAGLLSAPLAGLSISLAAVLTGLASAILGVAGLSWPNWLMTAAAAATGLVASMAAFSGHAAGSIPATGALGILGGMALAAGLPFALVSASRDLTAAPWLGIGWRIAASWLAATAILLAALRFA
jgi:hypothetical protein